MFLSKRKKMEHESIKLVSPEASPLADTIQCHLFPEISAVDMEIRWFKETECVCFYKNGRFIEGIGYEGRVSLCNEELKRGNVSLQLKESDDGYYLCQVISGNRTEERTVNKCTPWTEQPDKIWTDEDRKEMDNSVFLTVFQTLEKTDTEKNRLQKDLQDIKATVLQTSREMEEKQNQIEPKPMQQEDESAQMSGYVVISPMEISACELEEQTTTNLDNQQSGIVRSLENGEKTETETVKNHIQNNPQGNTVLQADRGVEEKLNQTVVKTTQQEDKSTQTCENMEISAVKTSDLKEQAIKMDNHQSEKIKVFSISDGKTNECNKQFIDTLQTRIGNLMEVSTEEESDIILNFCPIVSRAGTDIDAALNKIKNSKESKLNVLVVLHHTFDPEKTVLDSSRSVNREDTLTVDLLFYEDTGLLECQKNSDGYDKVVNWLIQQGREKGIREKKKTVKKTDKSSGSFWKSLLP